jgi:hypothetical protein
MLAWSACQIIQHFFPSGVHTLVNITGNFQYAAAGVAVIAGASKSLAPKFKYGAEVALAAVTAYVCIGETIGGIPGTADPMDIPAGVIGAAIGYVVGHNGLNQLVQSWSLGITRFMEGGADFIAKNRGRTSGRSGKNAAKE